MSSGDTYCPISGPVPFLEMATPSTPLTLRAVLPRRPTSTCVSVNEASGSGSGAPSAASVPSNGISGAPSASCFQSPLTKVSSGMRALARLASNVSSEAEDSTDRHCRLTSAKRTYSWGTKGTWPPGPIGPIGC